MRSVSANDYVNNTIREISPAGVVSTVAGIAGAQALVTGPLPLPLPDVESILWLNRALYISDSGDDIILSVTRMQ